MVLLALPLNISAFMTYPSTVHAATSAGFAFAAAGDLNTPLKGAGFDSLRSLNSTNPDFFLALGDLSYNHTYTGTQWCRDFKSQFKNTEIIPGYHDTGDDANLTDISATRSYERFVGSATPPPPTGCPYTINGVSSLPPCESFGCNYGREYYFDYPPSAPLARFVMLSPYTYNITGKCDAICMNDPARTCNSHYDCWNYKQNDLSDKDFNNWNHWNWTKNVIDVAVDNNEWVIVGVHKLCISAASENCEIGTDLFNLLISEKVDLLLSGDDHAYERSKQLSINNTSATGQLVCQSGIILNRDTWATFNPDCIVDDGSSGYYRPGAGTVLVTAGTFGSPRLYNVADPSANSGYNYAEAGYFASLMGGNTPGSGNGFVTYTVSGPKNGNGRIDVETHFSGTFQDQFSITAPPVSIITWNPINPQAGDQIVFSVSTEGGVAPYTYTWTFGDGTTGEGASPAHIYTRIGSYVITLKTVDSQGLTRVTSLIIGVGSWNAAVPCSPTSTTLESTIGNVTIQRMPSNQNSTGADYSGGAFKLAGNQGYGSNPTNWPFSKRALYPFRPPLSSPCQTPSGTTAFIEIHALSVLSVSVGDCGTSYDVSNGGGPFPNGQNCSTTFNLASTLSPCPACYMHRIYAVIDRDWKAAKIAPLSPVNGQMIDVQGFIYWNPLFVNQIWHSYSGWELHVSAWKDSTTPMPHDPAPFLSERALYVIAALAIITVMVVAYAVRLPAAFKAALERSRVYRRVPNSSESAIISEESQSAPT